AGVAAGGGRRWPRRAGGAGRAGLPAAGVRARRGQWPGPGAGAAGGARASRLAGLPPAAGAHGVHDAAAGARHRGRRRTGAMTGTVWIVDDDRSVRFVLAAALGEAGFEVVGFDSAAAVLDALGRRAPPALLFTDVRMPGDDGLVLLDRLKHAHPALPVVVMSAYTDVASTAGAFRGGAHEFLSKPFDLDDAVALARRVLAQRDGEGGEGEAAPEPSAEQGGDALVGDSP